jgi:hypothetical protein
MLMATFRSVREMIAYDASVIDLALPRWARRSHPVIRRHLGLHWKMMPPDWETMLGFYLAQVVVIGFTVALPALFTVLGALVITSLLLLPSLIISYANTLRKLCQSAAMGMASEVQEGTITLLRITPLPLGSILWSKAAAAVWRQGETLGGLLWAVVLLSLPMAVMEAALYFSPERDPWLARLVMIGVFSSGIARLLLEPLMIACVGQLIGVLVPYRTPAGFVTIAFAIFYFVSINMLRLLPLDGAGYAVVVMALPVLLPAALSVVSIYTSVFLITRD